MKIIKSLEYEPGHNQKLFQTISLFINSDDINVIY